MLGIAPKLFLYRSNTGSSSLGAAVCECVACFSAAFNLLLVNIHRILFLDLMRTNFFYWSSQLWRRYCHYCAATTLSFVVGFHDHGTPVIWCSAPAWSGGALDLFGVSPSPLLLRELLLDLSDTSVTSNTETRDLQHGLLPPLQSLL